MAKPNFTLPNKPAIKSGSILSYNYTDDFTFVPAPLTFNRDSAATRVNEKGLIEDVGYFGPELVQNGNFSEIGSELVTNGDFATDSDWSNFGTPTTSEQSTDKAYLGSYSWYVVASAFRQGIFSPNNFSLVSGKTYRASLWIYALDGAEILSGVTNSDASVFTSRTVAQGQWTNVVYYFTANASSASYISILSSSSTLEFYVDNVSVKEVGQNWTFGTGWSIKDGKAYYDGVENFKSLGQNNVVELGKKYRLNLDVSGLTNDIVVDVLSGNQFANPRYLTLSNGNVSFEFTSTNSLNNRFAIQAASGDEVYLDNISVIEVLGDKPRIDYSDSLTEPSLLLEPQSTNKITYSEDFTSNPNYITNAPSGIFESGYLAPDGTLTATRINGFDGYYVTLSATGSGDARSMFVKSGNGQSGSVNLLDPNSNSNSLFEVTSEWKRVELVGVDSWFYIADGRGASLTLDDIIVWGLQQEDLSYATSYIPTEGSTVTRLGETAINAGDVNVFNSEEGVLYAEFATISKNYNFPTIRLYDGTNNNAVRIFPVGLGGNNIQAQVDSGGSISFVSVSTNNDPTQYNKIAVKYQKDNFSFYINGTQHATDNSGNTPVGLNKFEFQSNLFYGKVRNVKVFNKALTDRELEILTIQ